MLKRIANLPIAVQHSLIYASAIALSKGLALIMVPVSTHFLTPEDYGRLDVLQTLADLLSIVIGMGLAETLFRFAGSADNEIEKRKASANIFGMAICLGGLALILGQLFAGPISRLLPGDIAELDTRLILASLSMVGTILIPLAWLRMSGMAWSYLIGTAGRVALQVAIAVPLLFMGFGVTGVLCATLASAILLCSWLIRKQLKDTGISFEFSRFKTYSIYGGPLIFVGISGFVLGSFDRWILADAVGTAEMAQYALAAKFGLITAVLIQPFDLWWHARRFSCLKETNGKIRCAKIGSLGVMIAIIAALFIAAAGPTMVRLLTPSSYHDSIAFIPWLAALAAVHNMTSTLAFGAMSENTTVRPAMIDGAAAFIALIAYLTLIPIFHAWGAIAATCLALGSRLVATYYVSQRSLQLPYQLRRLLFTGTVGVLCISLISSAPLSWSVLLQNGAIMLGFITTATVVGLIPIPKKILSMTTQMLNRS
ncbi:lipopolysaccharide biosynthesis protein [Neptuniibacter sp. QD29_5]|uniref:lipopolysaccharide biosynthesis protein n=1 Tax=Neptuniibacter sp. QD29_5 TaxID=3398207 RepID=UPI0039F5F232